jgi:hypothetical protein
MFLSQQKLVFIVIIGSVLCAAPAHAQQADQPGQLPDAIRGAKIYKLPEKGGQPAPNPAVYKNIAFQDINTERLLLNLFVTINPVDKSATVEHMYFQNVAVNGIPVHIDSLDQEFKLSNKDPVDLPAPLQCTIIFADLNSMQPVRDMVDKDQVLITGQSYIEVKLNSVEKLALRAKQVVIPVTMNETVPVNFFQGNPLVKMAADTILDSLSNPASAAAINMAKEHLAKMHLDDVIGGKVKPALYLLNTVYQVQDPKSKATEQFSQSGTGFLVSADGKLLTTKRVIQPWKFDPQVDFLIEHQQMTLDPASVKTCAWPAGAQVLGADGQPNADSALCTDKQSLKILATAPDEMAEQSYQDPDSGEKAALHLHSEGPADVAVLQITGSGLQPLAFPDASAAVPASLVLCSYALGISQAQSVPRLLSVPVAAQSGALTMQHTADPGESGAPLLDSDGKVAALAASANHCISIQDARKLIP